MSGACVTAMGGRARRDEARRGESSQQLGQLGGVEWLAIVRASTVCRYGPRWREGVVVYEYALATEAGRSSYLVLLPPSM